jgi:hypothetical protein
MNAHEQLIDAVFYALRAGCFFPVPEPRPGATVRELIQWGAMRHLHDAIAEFDREKEGNTWAKHK